AERASARFRRELEQPVDVLRAAPEQLVSRERAQSRCVFHAQERGGGVGRRLAACGDPSRVAALQAENSAIDEQVVTLEFLAQHARERRQRAVEERLEEAPDALAALPRLP